MVERNAPPAVKNGKFMTDLLGTWVKKGFVAGPFDDPPFEQLRSNL
jgi:hypothetical protein